MSRSEPTKAQGFVFSAVYSEFKVSEEPREKSPAKITFTPADQAFLESKNAKCGYLITAEIDPTNIPIGLYREAIKLRCRACHIRIGKRRVGEANAEKPEDGKSDR